MPLPFRALTGKAACRETPSPMNRTLLAALAALISCSMASIASAQAQKSQSVLGRNVAANCASCHGTNGRSVSGMPALAGRPRGEIARMLREFRDGKRPATIMQQIAKGYSDAQIDAVSDFLASQTARAR
jgi:sulfide dehydrogenase cytochrome subunit